MADLQSFFHIYYEVTSSHRKRQKNDMQPEFSYMAWLFEAPVSEYPELSNPQLYKSEKRTGGPIGYVSYWTEMERNVPQLNNFSKNKAYIKFLCVNDLMDHEKPESKVSEAILKAFYEELYPTKSKFEL